MCIRDSLQTALLAVGQAGGQLVLHVLQTHDLQQLQYFGTLPGLLLAVQVQGGGKQVAGAAHVLGDQHVVKYRLSLPQADVLELSLIHI